MAPARNASSSPPASEPMAACAVRTLARTDTFMPMKARGAGQDGADRKADGDEPAEEIADDEEDHDADDGDRGVLPPQIGLRALAHRRGYFLHLGAAGIGPHHRKGGPDGVKEGEHAAENDEPQSRHGKPRLMDAAGVETGPEGERPREAPRVQPKRRGHCQITGCACAIYSFFSVT